MKNERDIYFMKEALKEARKASIKGEVPVGCVIVWQDRIIARGHNQSIKKCDPSAHAEMLALRKAAKRLDNYRIPGCEVFVTVKPCKMCEGAFAWARVKSVTYGSEREEEKINHKYITKAGILRDDCGQIIKRFFGDIRSGDKRLKKERTKFSLSRI